MKSNEFAPMAQWIVPTIVGITCLIPVAVWFASVGDPLQYFSKSVPPGQTLYIFSKLFGLLALALIWLQCMTALARLSPALRGFMSLGRKGHIVLGVTSFVLVVVHAGAFIGAGTVRTHHLTLPLLVPKFDAGFHSAFVSIGAIAFWMALVVVIAGVLRVRGYRASRLVHRLSFLVVALGFIHAITIGSETRFGWMAYVYAFMGLSLVSAVGSLLWQQVGSRRRAQIAAATDSTGST